MRAQGKEAYISFDRIRIRRLPRGTNGVNSNGVIARGHMASADSANSHNSLTSAQSSYAVTVSGVRNLDVANNSASSSSTPAGSADTPGLNPPVTSTPPIEQGPALDDVSNTRLKAPKPSLSSLPGIPS